MPERVVLWDFDGTLAERDGMWSGCLLALLDAHDADHAVDVEDLRPHLASGFPWHDADRPHPELNDPDAWWAAVNPLFAAAYEAVGYPTTEAAVLAARVRDEFVCAERWRVFDDVVPALEVAGSPSQVWMVGDSATADIAGAERCRIPAVLVRRDAPARYRAADLRAVADLIAKAPPAGGEHGRAAELRR